jgi:hypothetical protein
VLEVLKKLNPDGDFNERENTYAGGRDKPRTMDEALAELRDKLSS